MFIFPFLIYDVLYLSLYNMTQILKITEKSDFILCSKKEITKLRLARFFS